ncbi:hypothetical protein [Flaviaesturariibacter amylovorans]|uniref:Uncharacterized protein n=1 Tax=Flaviaesturariibacter amylovorans TaxID=1084520 RepID=A0ABP8HE81_9BACT
MQPDDVLPVPGTGSRGNASNPEPEGNEAPGTSPLFDKKAETYLREGGVIEDMPDPQEEQEAEDTMREGDHDGA